MAAAEVRAAWQRTANRCFVQEDAKRAPKLACCPSSSPTPQQDSGNGNAASERDHPAPNFMPLNWNTKNSNLPEETKWWLQLQPSYGYQKDFTCEKLKALDDEVENKKIENLSPSSTHNGETLSDGPMDVDIKSNVNCSLESPWMVTTAFMKHDSETKVEQMKKTNNNLQQPLKQKVDRGEYFYQDEELMDWKHADWLISKQTEKAFSDMELPWSGDNKCTPWWRISDKDELASLVAQKSLQHIENCDLPRPTQTLYVSGDPDAFFESLDTNGIFSAPLGYKLHGGTCNPVDFTQHSSSSASMDDKYWSSSEPGHLYDNGKPLRSAHAYGTTTKGLLESKQASDKDASRAQLLEALRHSQTRAREAEIAAQKAYNEKEHIVKLLFRQASHLFAYKQWLHILQLENLYLQLKIKEHQISTLLPDLPWMPMKGKPSSKDRRKGKKQRKCNTCKNMVAFALGLGLAGAGMLLGWTLGWLLPCF